MKNIFWDGLPRSPESVASFLHARGHSDAEVVAFIRSAEAADPTMACVEFEEKAELDPDGRWITVSGNHIHITGGGEIDAGGPPALREILADKAGLKAKGDGDGKPKAWELNKQRDGETREQYNKRIDKETPKASLVRKPTAGEVKDLREKLKAVIPGVKVRQSPTLDGGLSVFPPKERGTGPFTLDESNAIRKVLRDNGVVFGPTGDHQTPRDAASSSFGALVMDANGPHPEFKDEPKGSPTSKPAEPAEKPAKDTSVQDIMEKHGVDKDTASLLNLAHKEAGVDPDKAMQLAAGAAKVDGSSKVQAQHAMEAVNYLHKTPEPATLAGSQRVESVYKAAGMEPPHDYWAHEKAMAASEAAKTPAGHLAAAEAHTRAAASLRNTAVEMEKKSKELNPSYDPSKPSEHVKDVRNTADKHDRSAAWHANAAMKPAPTAEEVTKQEFEKRVAAKTAELLAADRAKKHLSVYKGPAAQALARDEAIKQLAKADAPPKPKGSSSKSDPDRQAKRDAFEQKNGHKILTASAVSSELVKAGLPAFKNTPAVKQSGVSVTKIPGKMTHLMVEYKHTGKDLDLGDDHRAAKRQEVKAALESRGYTVTHPFADQTLMAIRKPIAASAPATAAGGKKS